LRAIGEEKRNARKDLMFVIDYNIPAGLALKKETKPYLTLMGIDEPR
jgi:hypothetical protein